VESIWLLGIFTIIAIAALVLPEQKEQSPPMALRESRKNTS